MKITDWESIPKFLDALREEYRVIAPTDVGGKVNFREIESGRDVIPEFINTKNSPKNFFIQNSYPVFSNGNYLKDIENLKFEVDGKSLIFGLRACDINALSLLDQFYFDGLLSHDYEKNRRRTAIIGMNCSWPGDNCFCSTFNAGPSIRKGADIVFTDLGNLYFVEVFSNGGKQIIDRFPNLFLDSTTEHKKKKDELMKEAKKRIKKLKVKEAKNKLKLTTDRYWDKLDKNCIGCYSCDIVCPTVYSFEKATELKRPTKKVRHRLNHVMENYGEFGCVGCGRCLDACPRGIGMVDILEDINRL